MASARLVGLCELDRDAHMSTGRGFVFAPSGNRMYNVSDRFLIRKSVILDNTPLTCGSVGTIV